MSVPVLLIPALNGTYAQHIDSPTTGLETIDTPAGESPKVIAKDTQDAPISTSDVSSEHEYGNIPSIPVADVTTSTSDDDNQLARKELVINDGFVDERDAHSKELAEDVNDDKMDEFAVRLGVRSTSEIFPTVAKYGVDHDKKGSDDTSMDVHNLNVTESIIDVSSTDVEITAESESKLLDSADNGNILFIEDMDMKPKFTVGDVPRQLDSESTISSDEAVYVNREPAAIADSRDTNSNMSVVRTDALSVGFEETTADKSEVDLVYSLESLAPVLSASDEGVVVEDTDEPVIPSVERLETSEPDSISEPITKPATPVLAVVEPTIDGQAQIISGFTEEIPILAQLDSTDELVETLEWKVTLNEMPVPTREPEVPVLVEPEAVPLMYDNDDPQANEGPEVEAVEISDLEADILVDEELEWGLQDKADLLVDGSDSAPPEQNVPADILAENPSYNFEIDDAKLGLNVENSVEDIALAIAETDDAPGGRDVALKEESIAAEFIVDVPPSASAAAEQSLNTDRKGIEEEVDVPVVKEPFKSEDGAVGKLIDVMEVEVRPHEDQFAPPEHVVLVQPEHTEDAGQSTAVTSFDEYNHISSDGNIKTHEILPVDDHVLLGESKVPDSTGESVTNPEAVVKPDAEPEPTISDTHVVEEPEIFVGLQQEVTGIPAEPVDHVVNFIAESGPSASEQAEDTPTSVESKLIASSDYEVESFSVGQSSQPLVERDSLREIISTRPVDVTEFDELEEVRVREVELGPCEEQVAASEDITLADPELTEDVGQSVAVIGSDEFDRASGDVYAKTYKTSPVDDLVEVEALDSITEQVSEIKTESLHQDPIPRMTVISEETIDDLVPGSGPIISEQAGDVANVAEDDHVVSEQVERSFVGQLHQPSSVESEITPGQTVDVIELGNFGAVLVEEMEGPLPEVASTNVVSESLDQVELPIEPSMQEEQFAAPEHIGLAEPEPIQDAVEDIVVTDSDEVNQSSSTVFATTHETPAVEDHVIPVDAKVLDSATEGVLVVEPEVGVMGDIEPKHILDKRVEEEYEIHVIDSIAEFGPSVSEQAEDVAIAGESKLGVSANYEDVISSAVGKSHQEFADVEIISTGPVNVVEPGDSEGADEALFESRSVHSLEAPKEENERPRSPWTPSYSVSTLGGLASTEQDIEEAEQLSAVVVEAVDSTEVIEDKEQSIPKINFLTQETDRNVADLAETPAGQNVDLIVEEQREVYESDSRAEISDSDQAKSLLEKVVAERPKSPWTPSYSVTTLHRSDSQFELDLNEAGGSLPTRELVEERQPDSAEVPATTDPIVSQQSADETLTVDDPYSPAYQLGHLSKDETGQQPVVVVALQVPVAEFESAPAHDEPLVVETGNVVAEGLTLPSSPSHSIIAPEGSSPTAQPEAELVEDHSGPVQESKQEQETVLNALSLSLGSGFVSGGIASLESLPLVEDAETVDVLVNGGSRQPNSVESVTVQPSEPDPDAPAEVEDDTRAPSFSLEDLDEERSSTWTPSYSVTNLSGSSPCIVSKSVEITDVNQLDQSSTLIIPTSGVNEQSKDAQPIPIIDEPSPKNEVQSADRKDATSVEVSTVDQSDEVELCEVKEDETESQQHTKLEISEDVPQRPWTPSYSSYTQGPGLSNGAEDDEDSDSPEIDEPQGDIPSRAEELSRKEVIDIDDQEFPRLEDSLDTLSVKPILDSLQPVDPSSSMLSSRSRYESTASSRFFPGAWFSSPKSPSDEGRPSLDEAVGEFIPSKPVATPKEPTVEENSEEDHKVEEKSKWCPIM